MSYRIETSVPLPTDVRRPDIYAVFDKMQAGHSIVVSKAKAGANGAKLYMTATRYCRQFTKRSLWPVVRVDGKSFVRLWLVRKDSIKRGRKSPAH